MNRARKGIKRPKQDLYPTTQKKPKTKFTEEEFVNRCPAWQLGIIDFGGSWGWGNVDEATLKGLIYDNLKNYESMTWAEITTNTGSHNIEIRKIKRDAQKRLKEIGQDDIACIIHKNSRFFSQDIVLY